MSFEKINLHINRPVASKINAIAAVQVVLNMLAAGGYIPEDQVQNYLVLVNTVLGVLIYIMRTFFTVPKDVIEILEGLKTADNDDKPYDHM